MIHIITTGGTIAGLDYHEIKDKPSRVSMGIDDFFKVANVSFDYQIEGVFDKDSRFVTEDDRQVLGDRIKALTTNKILVTHGTITMVETARFLGTMNLRKTIVLTGALVLGTEVNTDAPFNLGFAVSALRFLENGVYIAMNGKIFDWDNVRKNLDTNQFETLSE